MNKRAESNTYRVHLLGKLMPLMTAALLLAILVSSCSSSGDEPVEPTQSVLLTPSDRAISTPVIGISTPVSDPPTPISIAPTATPTQTKSLPPTATAAAALDPTATPAPPTPTPFPLGGDFFLNLIKPAELDVFATSSTLSIVGQTRVDAVVTVNDDIVSPDAEGIFEHMVSLEQGINIIEVVGSVSSDEQTNYVITVVYLP